MERRNRGLSLLNQTAAHCISPSSCDQFTSLNVINLQLHASSTVSNPYTFSIKSNTKFDTEIIPESEIYTLTIARISFAEGDTGYGYYGFLGVQGDLSLVTYKGDAIFALCCVRSSSYGYDYIDFMTSRSGEYASNPVLTIVDKNVTQIQDIVLKPKNYGGFIRYESDPLDVSIFSMFKASSAIKLRIR